MRSTSHITQLCVFWILGSIANGRAENSTSPAGFLGDVDLVFTWVSTPNATQWAAIKQACPQEEGGMQRFRDIGTFHVALKLALKNLPWVRNIYVVTNGQFPEWLTPATADKKIKFVTHKDMWKPEWQSDLPTYSSMAIESHLHRIKGLAEHFIYANDDILFLQPISRSDVFDANGMPHFFTDNFRDDADWKMAQRDFTRGMLPDKPRALMFAHMASVFRKSFIEKAQQKWPLMIENASHSKCRLSLNASPLFFFNFANVVEGATPSDLHKFKFANGGTMRLMPQDGDEETRLGHIRDFLNVVRASKPYIMCLNDYFDQDEKKAQRQIAIVNEFLAEVDHKAGLGVSFLTQKSQSEIHSKSTSSATAVFAVSMAIVMILACAVAATTYWLRNSSKYGAFGTWWHADEEEVLARMPILQEHQI